MAEDVASRLVRFTSVSARRLMPCLARAKAVACPIPGSVLDFEGWYWDLWRGFGKWGSVIPDAAPVMNAEPFSNVAAIVLRFLRDEAILEGKILSSKIVQSPITGNIVPEYMNLTDRA